MPEQTPRVSVIMRTKNADWVVEDALKGLYAQNFKDFELLVVDSGSTDRTLDIVRRFPHRLIEIEAKAYFPGMVLNSAIEQTQGDIVVFLNSDSVAQHPEALERIVGAFNDPAVQAAFARQTPRPEAHGWVRRDYASSFPEKGPAPEWITMSLPLAAMRRSCWQQHPFYTSAWASEDTEWGLWARKAGHHVAYVADAIVMHSHNYTLSQLYGRRFVEGEADAFIYGGKATLGSLFRQWLRDTVRDSLWCLKSGEFAGLMLAPVRRFVYGWAYWKGHLLGEERIARGDGDASRGQAVVLARHD